MCTCIGWSVYSGFTSETRFRVHLFQVQIKCVIVMYIVPEGVYPWH